LMRPATFFFFLGGIVWFLLRVGEGIRSSGSG
jgi:hypothetical protein